MQAENGGDRVTADWGDLAMRRVYIVGILRLAGITGIDRRTVPGRTFDSICSLGLQHLPPRSFAGVLACLPGDVARRSTMPCKV